MTGSSSGTRNLAPHVKKRSKPCTRRTTASTARSSGAAVTSAMDPRIDLDRDGFLDVATINDGEQVSNEFDSREHVFVNDKGRAREALGDLAHGAWRMARLGVFPTPIMRKRATTRDLPTNFVSG